MLVVASGGVVVGVASGNELIGVNTSTSAEMFVSTEMIVSERGLLAG